MKLNKKKVLSVALVVCIIAIISLGSLAWFTDKEEVTNTFAFVTPDQPSEGFSIRLFEHDWTKPNTDVTETGVTYTNVLPGAELPKDPTVMNDGAYDEYVRLIVTLDDFDVWSKVVKPDPETGKVDLASIFTGFKAAKWERPDAPIVSQDGKSISYTFYYKNVLHPYATSEEMATLFTGVVIPGELTVEQATAMGGQFNLKVEAEAIQADNLPEGVDTAYEAFDLLN